MGSRLHFEGCAFGMPPCGSLIAITLPHVRGRACVASQTHAFGVRGPNTVFRIANALRV